MTSETTTTTGFAPVRAGTDQALRLVMQDLWLTGKVLPVGAVLEVRHLFKSGETQPVEAVYAFMLPRDATLRRFRVVGENFSVQSALKPTAQAVAEYERGLEKGHLAALTRQYRDGLVNLNLGNLRPDESVVVVLEILAGVETRDDGVRFRFPFTLAPVYHRRARYVESEPGVGEMELPEEEFGDVLLPPWMKDARDLHRVGFGLEMALGQPVVEIASPSHSIRAAQGDRGRWRVSLAPEADIPDRDLVLDARVSQPVSTVFGGREANGNGQFIAVVPSTQFGKATGGPRQIVFVVDRSGSMQGAELQQAVRAVEACLGALAANDRFGIVAFDSETEVFQPNRGPRPRLCKADRKGRDAATEFLRGLGARGGTELAAAIRAACDLLPGGGGELFVVTDGQVGGTEDILREARQHGARLHCLGIGSASQDRFITLLARETGGVSRFVTPRERVDAAALELFASILQPVAVEITVRPSRADSVQIEPQPSATVWDGRPLVIYGETLGADPNALIISWKRDGQRAELRLPLELQPGADAETARLLRGARLITDVESRMNAAPGEESEDALKMLERLSCGYGLASRAMALVAVVKRPGDRPGAPPQTRVVPVGLPEDTAFEAYFEQAELARRSAQIAWHAAERHRLAESDVAFRTMACVNLHRTSEARLNELAEARHREMMRQAAYERRLEMALDLVTRIEPDGGLPGDNEQERVVRTLVSVLFLLNLEARTGRSFRPHMERLLGYLGSALSRIPEERRAIVERVMRLGVRRIAVEGDWEAEVIAILCGQWPETEVIWRKIEWVCAGRR